MLKTTLFTFAASMALVASAHAADGNEKTVRDAVQSLGHDIQVDSVEPSPMPGVYQVMASGRLVYVSADGKFMMNGDIIDIGKKQNLTEAAWASTRRAALAKVDDSHKLVFAPAKPKYTVTVFTDVDCAYCRELHKHIDEFNKQGIAVQYLFWPRTGVKTTAGNDTPSYTRAVSVWCAADRKATFNAAMKGSDVGKASCTNPVADDFALGERLGVSGTPTIMFEDGTTIPSYVTPDQLLAALRQREAGKPLDVSTAGGSD
ncbi:DsbC family protein [Pinirhizobacter sp.]|uniref:DsbC family protein n=1 Tax=Pinirhizobacter sp. TaxID=2950432 RepID=UPI002F3FD1A9